MTTRDLIYNKIPVAGLLMALVLFLASLTNNVSIRRTESVVSKTTARLEKRIRVLDRHIENIISTDPSELNMPEQIPEDMVIYRYVNDSLSSWSNQFPLINDDISSKMVFQRLTPTNNRVTSPLARISEKLSFVNLGPKWFVIKAVNGDYNDRIIAGIEIKNSLIDDISAKENGVNPVFKLNKSYEVYSLSETGGYTVSIDGTPLFKILLNSTKASVFFNNSILKWCALILAIISLMLYLSGRRTFRAYFTVITTIIVLSIISYFWGLQMNGTHEIFSPRIFADDRFFSLGALLISNALISLIFICTYLIKGKIKMLLNSGRRRKLKMGIFGITILACTILTALYTHSTLVSFIRNSNVSLELYKVHSNLLYTLLVYISYIGLFICMLMQIQLLRPVISTFTGKHYNMFSRKMLIFSALIMSFYLSALTCVMGFKKEEDMAVVWANRLAVERDLALELQLCEIEEQIADDHLISSLANMKHAPAMVQNRLKEYYFSRIQHTYTINVKIYPDKDPRGEKALNDILSNGEPIVDQSRFMLMNNSNGKIFYAGMFLYYDAGFGMTKVVITIEPNSNKEDKGYHNIIGRFGQPGDVNIPPLYSYAKYKNGRLSIYKGNFPYPTIPESFNRVLKPSEDITVLQHNKFTHFIVNNGENDVIVISRPKRNGLIYFTSFSYLFLLLTMVTFILPAKKNRKNAFKNNYFKTRINSILFASSFLLLSCMAIVSITFVYKRNESNLYNLMSSKISTIQNLVGQSAMHAGEWSELTTTEFDEELEEISKTTKSDITLFTPKGKIFKSTSPEIFEKMILGSRIDESAFYNIQSRNQRFYIAREKIAEFEYWALYAPLINDKGEMVALLSIPYTDRDYDFRKEGFFHTALIINVFLLLLAISLFFSTRMINSMFSPLVEMGKKMNNTNINNLEYISYDREDEISSLVEAYNRMVKELSESTLKLTQAERDKAWSQMARQVAHEIKNPLTPIKLEIQRLIRLKQNNNPRWEEKFDQVTAVILEHIQILSDTANEFSTFANLYTEEPVLMDLDKVLQDQLIIFDNKENIKISYIGMNDAMVMAPKPQLIRVFINLITNAIQAVEMQQKEAAENNDEVTPGRVVICLRHSTREGCYDIVFDDNGPGVSGDNLSKLFTPNFTTKSGGTGLGLAICRNIIEKCDGEITYKKSFALNGASFTVTIPKFHQ